MSILNNTHIQACQAVNIIDIEDVYPEFEQWIDFEIDDVDIVRDPNLSDHSHEYQIQSDSGQLQQVSSSHNERAQVDQIST
ncbi:hypothetical protein BGZ99_010450 [Dissophora globulifera]|uniref:Uncharacterized protein n=1 Tax=Dissophora globulifera TaxID=979702 RepID=A0A9P6UM33_9FUNG|nr:hypothetical protein BGZ99_010450 [Dissophora globulifera]